MKKNNNYKINRGAIEEEKRKTENSLLYQKAILFLLPVIMVAVLVVGIFFGYKSYKAKYKSESIATDNSAQIQEEIDNFNAKLLKVVNSASPEDENFVPELVDFNGIKISPLMKYHLEDLLFDAKNEGLSLKVVNGYISFEEQKEIYATAVQKYKESSKASVVKAESYVKKTIPKEGECEQQTGLIVEFASDSDEDFEKSEEYHFLMKNCVNYGFILRYPNTENTGGRKFSPSLFRYVGIDHAKTMRSYNMTLDEYVLYLSNRG